MLRIDIPGFRNLALEHLVLDYNGTLAVDGRLMFGVSERLAALSADLTLHVVTADTFGRAREGLDALPVRLTILEPGPQAEAKRDLVRRLGAESVVAIGNGRNDRLMLGAAALGMSVSGLEGTAAEAIAAAHLHATDIHDALDLLAKPLRLVATRRG